MFRNRKLSNFIEFNPSESLTIGEIAKKIPMEKLTPYRRDIVGYEKCIYSSGPKFRNGDTVVAKITPCLENGKTALVDILAENEVAFGSSEFIVLRAIQNQEKEEDNTDPMFLYYLSISPNFRKRAISCMEGTSGRKRVVEATLKNHTLLVPDYKEQRQIATVLSAIDNKIRLNNQINHNLEAMAKQLYDYWFVQFDFPNEEGKPYKSCGGKMVWNEKVKREIPESWEVKSLFEGVEVQYGFPFSTDLFVEEETSIPIVRIRDILEGSISAYSTEEVNEKYCLHKGDVIIGMDGNFHINYWHTDTAFLNQRSVRLRAKNSSTISAIQIFHNVKPYIKAKELNAKGSTVGHLSDKDLKGLYLLAAPLTDNFNPKAVFDIMLNKILANKSELISLAKQRDELLPLLMNGQVSVNYDLSLC